MSEENPNRTHNLQTLQNPFHQCQKPSHREKSPVRETKGPQLIRGEQRLLLVRLLIQVFHHLLLLLIVHQHPRLKPHTDPNRNKKTRGLNKSSRRLRNPPRKTSPPCRYQPKIRNPNSLKGSISSPEQPLRIHFTSKATALHSLEEWTGVWEIVGVGGTRALQCRECYNGPLSVRHGARMRRITRWVGKYGRCRAHRCRHHGITRHQCSQMRRAIGWRALRPHTPRRIAAVAGRSWSALRHPRRSSKCIPKPGTASTLNSISDGCRFQIR